MFDIPDWLPWVIGLFLISIGIALGIGIEHVILFLCHHLHWN